MFLNEVYTVKYVSDGVYTSGVHYSECITWSASDGIYTSEWNGWSESIGLSINPKFIY